MSTSSPTAPPDNPAEVAFVRDWFSELDSIRHAGETGRFRQLSKGCSDCAWFADSMEDMYESGGGIRGGRFSDIEVARLGDTTEKEHAYFVTYTQSSSIIRDDGVGGMKERSTPRLQQAWHVWLRPTGSSYRMKSYQSLGEREDWMTRAVPDTAPDGETPEEFVERYYEVSSEMLRTGDAKTYREITVKCDTCPEYAERVEKLYRGGGAARGGSWTVLSARATRLSTAYLPSLSVSLATAAIRVRESPRAEWKREPVKRLQLEIDLVWTSEGYQVLRVLSQ